MCKVCSFNTKSDNEIAILTQTIRFPKLKHFIFVPRCVLSIGAINTHENKQ